jgi:quercetin dioxygenase-like cupin family protein
MMKRTTARVSLASAAALALTMVALVAQAPAIERVVLQRADLAAQGREGVMAKAQFPAAGATTGRHTHPGEEISYVLDGTVRLEVDGQPARDLKAGDFFIVPAEKIHNAVATSKATVLATYVVEKGKPLTSPAKYHVGVGGRG